MNWKDDEVYITLKKELKEKFDVNVHRKTKPLFDDIVIPTTRQNKASVIAYIMGRYKQYMKLRVNIDNDLIYMYTRVSKEKYEEIKRNEANHNVRFKWLYEQIKDEKVFLKNAIQYGGDKDG